MPAVPQVPPEGPAIRGREVDRVSGVGWAQRGTESSRAEQASALPYDSQPDDGGDHDHHEGDMSALFHLLTRKATQRHPVRQKSDCRSRQTVGRPKSRHSRPAKR